MSQHWHEAAAALRSLARELERTKDDLRRVESVYNFAKLSAERDSLAQEVERLKTEHINAEMAHGALHAIHELLDDGGVPRGTFADDHVRNLVAMYNQRGMRIRELEAECAAIRAKTIEECAQEIQEEFDRPDMADAIRALATEATEAVQGSEKLDQKSRPSV